MSNWADEEGRGEQLDYAADFYDSCGIAGARYLGLTEEQCYEYDPTTGQWG